MDIGKAIRTIRKEKGLSQEQLGEKINLSGNAISQIELGATFPQTENIKKICEALEVPPAYLMFFCITDEDMPPDGRAIFNALQQPIRNLLIENIKNKKEMAYHSKSTAEEIRKRHLHLRGGNYFNVINEDKAELTDITVDPAAHDILVDGKRENGYFCIFRFDKGPSINATEFTRLNNLPEVGGLYPKFKTSSQYQ